ncbi:hypothetical protein [Pseudovibrio sp. Tun.PSC04-5.I4]|uniref:hypothetical protein n=1 Tax=Pseudovibrio sp. Tun.PSC04-5.I4 TaxID=1798213 RepID=UPI00088BB6BA|nr:hypothetical protein [Pseudovibrio sp. Tun.PSC04-5.I4]SDR45505.1 hypothetical protein SAMN04515695_5579 [Pseudovibrio sp. Tun.PSC04-5.I4]
MITPFKSRQTLQKLRLKMEKEHQLTASDPKEDALEPKNSACVKKSSRCEDQNDGSKSSQERVKVSEKSVALWASLTTWATEENCEYLKQNNVQGFGVKKDKDGRMVVPLRDMDFKFQSLLFIGHVTTNIKHGRRAGLFHVIDPQGRLSEERKLTSQETLVITRSYASAAVVHEMVKAPVIVAFSVLNIIKFAKSFREKYPDVTLLFALDAMAHQKVNPRLPVMQAAQDVGGHVIIPPFRETEKSQGLKDWNDLVGLHGKDRAELLFAAQVRYAFDKKRNRKI